MGEDQEDQEKYLDKSIGDTSEDTQRDDDPYGNEEEE